jgi:hypothetical protein
MKRNVLLTSDYPNTSGNFRCKSIRTGLLVILLCLAGFTGFSAVTVVPAPNGGSICSTVATSPTNVGTITITEGATNDFPAGASQLVLAPPVGWSFVAVLPTISAVGGDVTIGVTSITAGLLTINFNSPTTTHIDAITIANLQVTANTVGSSTGNIFAQTDLGIAGIATGSVGTNFGTLSIASAVAPSVSVSGVPGGAICAGTGVTFTPTPTNGGTSPTYQWFLNGTSVGTSPFYSSSSLANGNTVYCIMTVVGGSCVSPATATSNTVTMTVNPQPTIVTVSGAGTYCGNTTITAANGGSGTIYFQGTTTGGTSTSTPSVSQVVSASGTYYFNAQSALGCWGPQGSVTVSINPTPSTVTVTGGGSFCGGTTTLNASNLGDGTIYYEGAVSNGVSLATPSSSQVIAASGTYYFRAYNGTCWGTQGSATVVINPVPAATVVAGAGIFCGSTTVTASGGGGGTIYFQGTTSGGTSTSTPSVSQVVTSSGTYYFNSQSAAGCWGAQGSTAVTINPSATANAGLPQSICAGTTITLAGSIGGGASTSTWTAPSGTFSNASSLTSTYTPTIGSGVVTLTLTTNDPDGAGPCTSAVSTVNITVNALPNTPTVTGGGTACGFTTLNASLVGLGTIYYEGTTSGGTSIVLGGTPQIVTATNTYYFRALSGGCWGPQSVTAVTINPLPNPYTVTGGGGYCAGSTGSDVGLSSSDAGINYQLQRGGVNVGPIVPGTLAALDMGLQTVAGIYTVVATNPTTSCTLTMGGSASVSINALPTQYTVTGTGSYCAGGAGVTVNQTGSAAGVTYQLMLSGLPVGSPVAGTGLPITFGTQTAAGTYTAIATNTTTGCTNNMLGSAVITVNPAPAAFSVTGGGAVCTGALGLNVGLASSVVGTSYQLYKGGVISGAAVLGTGSAITFGPQTTAATYTVVATIVATGCTANMTGSAIITNNPLPGAFSVTGGGNYCAGGTGVAVGLSGSAVGINYQLYVGGVSVGTPVAGTGSAITFGFQTGGGTYTVVATNATTSCTSNMTGSVIVVINALPTAYAVTGGGSYCTGGAGLNIGLANSQVGVSYQLYLSFVPFGAPKAGTGAALSWGLQTTAGFYSVVATNTTTSCTNNMTGGVAITILPLPTAYNVTGGGGYCTGGTGVHVGLSNSDIGVNYLLYLGAVPVGVPVAGTGGSLDFGLQTAGGTYTVIGTSTSTTCVNNMTGSVIITIDPLPLTYNVTGGGSYCSGGAGVDVAQSGSEVGVSYQLMLGGFPIGLPVAGTGSAIDFLNQTAAGTYTAVATNTVTGCTSNMLLSATVVINPLPTAYNVTGGGGGYCAGGTGFDLGLDNSDFGINYSLYNGGSLVSTLTGIGGALDFGFQTAAGTYTIVAIDLSTGCTATMSGSVVITVVPLPAIFNLTGGGAYCAGGTGVDVTLSGSELGKSYQLSVGGVPTGLSMNGTGMSLDFGLQTTVGTYSCVATDTTYGCTNNMTGAPSITTNPAPTVFAMTGGGAYCVGGTGVDVGLSGSVVGVNYQLYNGVTAVGPTMAGTGSALDYSLQTAVGTYTVIATDPAVTCTATMSGSAMVSTVAYPVVAAIVGPSVVCQGATATMTDATGTGIWSSVTTTIATVGTSGIVTGVSGGIDSIEYTVTNGTGCATMVSVTVDVLAGPAVATIGGTSTTICQGSTGTLTETTTGGTWSSSNTAVATVSTSGVVTGVSTGSAVISYTVSGGTGCTSSATVNVTIGATIPSSALLPTPSATLCDTNLVKLYVATAGGGSGLAYTWYLGGVAIPGAITDTYYATTPGSYSAMISNGTCSETFAATTVLNPPVPVISLDTIPYLLFTGSFVGYQWNMDGSAIPGATSNNTPERGADSTYYTVTVTDVNGCARTSDTFWVLLADTSLAVHPVVTPAYDIRIYPNPASSIIHIDAPVKVFVSVLNIDGSILIDHQEAISLNVGGLNNGNYILMIYDENNHLLKTEKLVKLQ